jgi:glycosyltransferase involved in cell wall biosynthesis
LKVAFVYIAPDIRGGVERAIIETEKRLAKLGCDVKLFCNRFNSATAFSELVEVQKEVVPHRLDLMGRLRMFYSMKAIRASTLKAAEWKPDIIMLGAGFLWTKYILSGLDIPAVSRVHVPVPIQHGAINRVYRGLTGLSRIERESLTFKPIICNSEYTRSMILKLEPRASAEVIYAGVDSEYFRPTWEDQGFLYLNGRFQTYKNQLLAIRALRNTQHRLILSGYARPDSADDTNYYKRILNESSSAANIELVVNPPMEKIRGLYQASSAVLVTSIGDPFPLVALEAMACGKPVAGLKSGGLPELLTQAGLLFENDPADLKKKVDEIMSDPFLRKSVGAKSRVVAEGFTWDKTAERFYSIFKRETVRQSRR